MSSQPSEVFQASVFQTWFFRYALKLLTNLFGLIWVFLMFFSKLMIFMTNKAVNAMFCFHWKISWSQILKSSTDYLFFVGYCQLFKPQLCFYRSSLFRWIEKLFLNCFFLNQLFLKYSYWNRQCIILLLSKKSKSLIGCRLLLTIACFLGLSLFDILSIIITNLISALSLLYKTNIAISLLGYISS